MGMLRSLFAIAVLMEHTSGNFLIGGRNAVQLFYMMSGFLISYILVERKTYPDIKHFYINRYLRIYPIYFVVAVMTLLLLLGIQATGRGVPLFNTWREVPWLADLLLLCANLTLFFGDWVMFAGIENHRLVFATNFWHSDVVLFWGLVIWQSWTLGVELSFYLLAPWILLKKRVLLGCLFVSLGLRVVLLWIGLGVNDPWTYRFFPTELALFLLGAVAHQFLLPLYSRKCGPLVMDRCAASATILLVSITLLYTVIPFSALTKSLALLSLFFLLLPFVFRFQSQRKWDQRLGDLSYPLYICHVLAMYLTVIVLMTVAPTNQLLMLGEISLRVEKGHLIIGSLAVSLGLAFLLDRYIGQPVEALRTRLKKKQILPR